MITTTTTDEQIKAGDTVYFFKSDPGCDTIYEVMTIRNGIATLFHPLVGKARVPVTNLKHSLY